MCEKCAMREIVATMRETAIRMGLKGVAVCNIRLDTNHALETWSPEMAVVSNFRSFQLQNENYAAMAWSMIAEMMDTGLASGTSTNRQPRTGEVSRVGGLAKNVSGIWIYTAFAGGTDEENLRVAYAGMESVSIEVCAADGRDYQDDEGPRILAAAIVAGAILTARNGRKGQ